MKITHIVMPHIVMPVTPEDKESLALWMAARHSTNPTVMSAFDAVQVAVAIAEPDARLDEQRRLDCMIEDWRAIVAKLASVHEREAVETFKRVRQQYEWRNRQTGVGSSPPVAPKQTVWGKVRGIFGQN